MEKLYKKIYNLSENELKTVLLRLLRSGRINLSFLNDVSNTFKEGEEYDKICKKVEADPNCCLCGNELRTLLHIKYSSIVEYLFGASSYEEISVSDYPFLFKRLRIYRRNVLYDKEFLRELCDSLHILNCYIKDNQVYISKNKFYRHKEKLLKYLYMSGYLESWHEEIRGDERFYSLTFNIDGNRYYFHQKKYSFFRSLGDSKEISSYMEHNMSSNISYNTCEIYERLKLIEYVSYCYFSD